MTATPTVAGLVLAAGAGRRLGRPKALVELAGERLVDRALRVLREGGCDPLLVVAGAAPIEVDGASVVVNADWSTGMASSLQAGLLAADRLPPEVVAVVVSLVDTPGIGADVVRRVVAAHRSGAALVVAAYDGRLRTPVLAARELWAEMARAAHGEEGGRAFVRARPELVTAVECGDVADPADIDTLADLNRLAVLADRAPANPRHVRPPAPPSAP